MNSNAVKFLQEIIGSEGSRALLKAAERFSILQPVLVPRAILSWLETVNRIGYEGQIPGMVNSNIRFSKSEDKFTGQIDMNGEMYKFENVTILHVAAAIGVALGINNDKINPLLKSQDIVNLGKDIDLLVKSHIIKSLMVMCEHCKKTKEEDHKCTKELEKDAMPPGKAAEPRPPVGFTKPTQATKQPKIKSPPKPPAIKKELQISKSESLNRCSDCSGLQFINNRFAGCICIRDLAKSVKTEIVQNGYNLQFSGDPEEFAIITKILKVKNGQK